jgi:Ca2+-binding RTX toxin-like protein
MNNTVGSTLSDAYLQLHNSSGSLIAIDDDGGATGYNALLTFTAQYSGVHYISAQGVDSTEIGEYTLSANTTSQPSPTASLNWGTSLSITDGFVDIYFASAGESFAGDQTASLAWNEYEISRVLAAGSVFSNYIGLQFRRTTNLADADFRMVVVDEIEGRPSTLGYFYAPGSTRSGIGVFARRGFGWEEGGEGGLGVGGYAFNTLLHEMGHGLGLSHPHDNGGTSSIMMGVTASFNSYGLFNLNQGVFTVMTYNDGWEVNPFNTSVSARTGNTATPMALDVAALIANYGANTTAGAGNSNYTLSGGHWHCIWDTGGVDTITASSAYGTVGFVIDLREATMIYAEGGGGYLSYLKSSLGANVGGYSVANGVVIENAVGAAGDDDMFGNGANNQISGLGGNDNIWTYGGNDTLDGGLGADIMYGGAGDDTYYVDDSLDAPLEGASEGTDSVVSAISWTLGDHIENLTIAENGGNFNAYGNALTNTLRGNAFTNILDGRGGADTMYGGAGNDIYYVDQAGDLVSEQTVNGVDDGGMDTVLSDITYTLTTFVETLYLNGSANINGAGNGLQNTLYGNSGNNTLDGGTNYDTMVGGGGNDTYMVDHDFDYIVENANAGTDHVMSSVSRLMNDNLENLTLTGTNNINGYANELANIVRGNGGNNIIDGRAGADTLYGGAGDDIYYIDNAGDLISEQTVNGVDDGGIDWVVTTVDHTLVQFTEHMILSGTAAHINATGNSVGNTLEGNTGNNTLSGLGGNDTLRGANGNDILIGGLGNDNLQGGNENDTYVFGLNWGQDFITEGTGTDTIRFIDGITAGDIITQIVGADIYYAFAEVGKTATQCANWVCVIGGAAGTVIETIAYGPLPSSSTQVDMAPLPAMKEVSYSPDADVLIQAILSFDTAPPSAMNRTQDQLRYANQNLWSAGAKIGFQRDFE